MAFDLLNHRYRKEKNLFKPFFLFGEAPAGAPQSHQEGVKAEEILPSSPELLTKGPLLDEIVDIKNTYNSIKRKLSDDLYLVFLDQQEEILDLKATLANVDELMERVGRKQERLLIQIKGLLEETLQKQGATGVEHLGAKESLDGNAVKAHGQILASLEEKILESHKLQNEAAENIFHKDIAQNYDAGIQRLGEFKYLREGAADTKALFLTIAEIETEDFTRALSQEEVNQKMAHLEAASTEVKQGGVENLHPSIRDNVIVRFYENLEKGEENTIGNVWVLEQLRQSSYFNEPTPNPESASSRRAALELAFAGGRAAQEYEILGNYAAQLEAYKETELSWDVLTNTLGLQLTEEDKKGTPATVLDVKIQSYRKRLEVLAHFLKTVQEILQHPYDMRGAPHDLLVQLDREGDKALGYGELGLIQPGQLLAYCQRAEAFELNKNTKTLGARVQRGADVPTAFESMGMDLKNAFSIYQREIANDNGLKTSQWDELIEKDPNRLADLIQKMTEGGGQSEGRKAFLVVLRSMNRPSDDPQIIYFRQVARSRVNDLKNHIESQNQVLAENQNAMSVIRREIEGSSSSIKDHLMSGFNTLWNKLFSGNPVDMALAAGTIFVIGSLVVGAIKNRDKWYGKLGIAGIVGLGGALWYEDIFGKKLLDQAKNALPGGLETAAQNTPELAMVDAGEERMNKLEKPIDRNEHLRGLIALHDVPYHKVIKWYQSTKTTEPDYDVGREERLFRELGIKENQVVLPGGNKIENHERVKYIIRQTVAHSIESEATQKKVSHTEAEKILVDTWIKPVDEPNFVSSHKGVVQYPRIYEEYHHQKNKLTFGKVLQAQMSIKRSEGLLIQKTTPSIS